MAKKLIRFYKGLPGSGKTFHATNWAKENPNVVLICKDDIRRDYFGVVVGDESTRVKEKKVISKRDELIIRALQKDKDIAVCDTNLNSLHEKNVRALVFPKYRDYYEFEIVDFTNIPVETCIERCSTRPEGKIFWEKVINKMKHEFIKPPIVEQDKSLPQIIITDFDGTIAHMCPNRSPYSGVGSENDIENEIVCTYLRTMYEKGYPIFILSGLEDCYKPHRENWLKANNVPYDYLYMRKTGDHRKDCLIKDDLFKEYIEDKYYIHAILDDRPQMVRYWIDKGYSRHLFAIGNPYHEF